MRSVGQDSHQRRTDRLPPLDAKHFSLIPLIQLPLLGVFEPDSFVAWNVERKRMVLEIAFVSPFRHVHLYGAGGQWSCAVEVHMHVCSAHTIGFGARAV